MDGEQERRVLRVKAAASPVRRPILKRLESHLWRRTLSGFFVLIPLFVTLLVLRFVFDYLDDLVRPWVRGRIDILDFPGIGVVSILVSLYVIGSLVVWEAGRRAVSWQSAVFSRIPVVRSIYGVTKQATDALSSSMGHEMGRVVFIEWPRSGMRAMGFVTGHLNSPDGKGAPIVAVYIPTVPNPTSGNLAFVSEGDIIESDISIEDAMKIVLSGGIVMPSPVEAVDAPEHADT